jgi:eukaryotic-like serine/threonine-protein kinase
MSTVAESIGRVLAGRYRIESVLGTGASAHVFCAWDVTLRRRVAVKMLHPVLASDSAFLRRFRSEAQAAAALTHPHVLAVYDWGEEGGGPFLVMEFLAGGSLRDLLDEGSRLSVSQAAAVGAQASQALAYAHGRGFVHRDIKPANLLFDEEGRLRIADFGLARALAEAAWTEPSGATLGTARYAAPEQALGNRVDGKADVYSLALVLYESVTGLVPFAADTTLSTLMARVGARLPGHDALGPLAKVLEAATVPDPELRLGASQLSKRLDTIASRLPGPEPLPLAGSPAGPGPGPGLAAAVGRSPSAVSPNDSTEHGSEASTEGAEARAQSGQSAQLGGRPEGEERAEGRENGARPEDDTETELFVLASAVGVKIDELKTRKAEDLETLVDEETPQTVTASPAPRSEPPQIHLPSARRGERRWLKVIVATLVVALVLAGLGYGLVRSRVFVPSHRVPSLATLTVKEASDKLRPDHFHLRVTGHEYSPTVASGSVVHQSPRQGVSKKEGLVVSVSLSNGPPPVAVPNLSSITSGGCSAVTSALAPANLHPNCVSQYSMQVPTPGAVIDWNPKGTATEFSTITVEISEGPPIETIPSLDGMSCQAVTSTLQAVGLQTSCVNQYTTDGTPSGQVIAGSWTPSSSAPEGSTVTVQISQGPPPVQVPAVPAGATLPQVETLLANAGLQPGQLYGPVKGVVFATNPSYPSSIPQGSSVNIYTR